LSTEIAKFYATIGADASGLKKGLDDVKSGLGGIQSSVLNMQNMVVNSFKVIGLAAAAMAGTVAVTGIQFNAMKEQADIAFTTMLGSGEAAQGMLDELQAFAAKTPFEFPDLIRASQRMMAMGFASEEVIPTLTAVGDAVAALGGGQVEIDRVTTALGQMNAKGKTSAEEMMQLTEAGIPAWQMLADKIGVSVPEAMKMVTAGAIDAKTTISAVVEGIDTRFGGMMAAQSQTFNGLISNLKDNFTQLSGTVMAPFFEMAKTGLKQVVDITSSPAFISGVRQFAEWMSKLSARMADGIAAGIEWATRVLPPLWEKFVQVADAIQMMIRPIGDAIGKFLSWKDIAITIGLIIVGAIGSIVVSMAPLIATVAAVTAAVSLMRWAWQNDFMGIQTTTRNALNKITDWFKNDSGIWKGTWEETLEYLEWWANGGWKISVFFPIRSRLIELRNEFNLWWLMTKNGFSKWTEDVKNTINDWKNKVVDKIGDFRNQAVNTFNHWKDDVLGKIEYFVNRADTKFTTWKNNMRGMAEDWRDDFLGKWKDISDWFDRNVGPWLQKGRDLMQGLWDGAKEIWNRFKSWWDGIWSKDVPKTVDVKMKIGSPSKLMEQYGKWTMQGFAIGAKDALPLVTDAMGGLSLAAAGAGQGAMGAASSQPNVSTSRIEELLTILIAELRAKNMTANVNVQGGGSYSGLVTHAAGMR
jgi:tape measure domain-containing protein